MTTPEHHSNLAFNKSMMHFHLLHLQPITNTAACGEFVLYSILMAIQRAPPLRLLKGVKKELARTWELKLVWHLTHMTKE